MKDSTSLEQFEISKAWKNWIYGKIQITKLKEEMLSQQKSNISKTL